MSKPPKNPSPEAYTQRAYAQISQRLHEDLEAIQHAYKVDRSTAIRAALRVGIMHSDEVGRMVERDKSERDRRHREASRIGGREGMKTRLREVRNAEAQTATALSEINAELSGAVHQQD